MGRSRLLHKEDMSARVRSVLDGLDTEKWIRTSDLAKRVSRMPYWNERSPAHVVTAVAGVCYELRKTGWIESRKSETATGRKGEYLHRRFPRRHTCPQAPIRNTAAARERMKHEGNGKTTTLTMATQSDSPLGILLAAAARIEQDINLFAEALVAVEQEINGYKELRDIVARLTQHD